MSKIDLHMHSGFSDDGELSARELTDRAVAAGLAAFAIADHNNVNAIGDAVDYCRGKDIELIPAVELDCMFLGRVYHLLGYGIDHRAKAFKDIWDDVIGQEQEASRKRVRLARELGIEFLDEDIEALSKWGMVGGEMIAEAAMKYDTQHKKPAATALLRGRRAQRQPLRELLVGFLQPGQAHIQRC
jgi:DNA polymerase III alpha subunit